ncbi:aminotransferase class V-fold PLP-dependent enzyme [Massilioclostridium coli]|uniref:aminotransferase class V-fold PLP-dependent enzyme n=1 Tax=Massilioclostridium coli TaxID=1870991 RepID=UPI00085C23DD|nr:aminotransferase class V-fold PLP-dependent enzyme [Massilioclostridium coli]
MIYFDNAATTYPKPNQVIQAVQQGMLRYGGNPGRSGHSISMRTAEKVYQVRNLAADFFDAEVENVIFTCNCTQALNFAIKGILLNGGHVITTNLEHNSVLRPIASLAKHNNVSYTIMDVYNQSEETILAMIKKAIRSDTKLIICTHGSNVTGQRLPIERIAKLCKEHNILFAVDGAQSAGVLPVQVRNMGIDLFCTAGHKSLYGPSGTGLLVLGNKILLETIMEGGTGTNSFRMEQPEFYPERMESGTVNTAGICGLGAGIQFLKQKGLRRIYQHEISLCRMAFLGLKGMRNIQLYTPDCAEGSYLPVFIFNVKGRTSMEVVDQLNDAGFALRGGLHCAPLIHQALGTEEIGGVRLSVSVFNKREEIQKFLSTMQKISK